MQHTIKNINYPSEGQFKLRDTCVFRLKNTVSIKSKCLKIKYSSKKAKF